MKLHDGTLVRVTTVRGLRRIKTMLVIMFASKLLRFIITALVLQEKGQAELSILTNEDVLVILTFVMVLGFCAAERNITHEPGHIRADKLS